MRLGDVATKEVRPGKGAGPLGWFGGLPGLALRPGLVPRPAPSIGRLGALEVRLAATAKDVRRAQRLRYKVFFEEMSAVPGTAARLQRRDMDAFDQACDHLLVLDHDVVAKPFRAAKPRLVATCRLLRQEAAMRHGGFYSAGEFDLAPLLSRHRDRRFLEIGRACVARPYRSRRTVELLWQGIWAHVLRHEAGALLGCASLDGTDLRALAPQLAYLHHFAASPAEWRVCAALQRAVAMDAVPREAINPRAVFKTLPPLVKGYLRVGATFGEHAVVDRAFGTTDVFTILPVDAISSRYIDHFGPSANRYPA